MHVDYGACSELQPLRCAFTEALWKWNIVWLHCVWPKEKRTSLIFPSQRNVMLVCWNVVAEVFQCWNCSRRQLAWTKLFKNCTENFTGAGVFTYCSDKPGLSTKIVLNIWSKLFDVHVSEDCWHLLGEGNSKLASLSAGVGSITRTTACWLVELQCG